MVQFDGSFTCLCAILWDGQTCPRSVSAIHMTYNCLLGSCVCWSLIEVTGVEYKDGGM